MATDYTLRMLSLDNSLTEGDGLWIYTNGTDPDYTVVGIDRYSDHVAYKLKEVPK